MCEGIGVEPPVAINPTTAVHDGARVTISPAGR